MFKSLKIIYGIIKHDILGYIEAYQIAKDWSTRFPSVDPSDFNKLQELAWEEINQSLQHELDTQGTSISDLHVPEDHKN